MNIKSRAFTILALLFIIVTCCQPVSADYGFTPSAKCDYGCAPSQRADYGFVPASDPGTQNTAVYTPGGYQYNQYPNSCGDYYPPYYFNHYGNCRPNNAVQIRQQPKSVTDPVWQRQQTNVTDAGWQRAHQQTMVTDPGWQRAHQGTMLVNPGR
jgi:hypothetical protein